MQQQAVGFFLLHMMRTGALAHADFIGIFAHEGQNFVRHQSVIQHHIGRLHRLQGVQRQQTGVALAPPHQHHFALLRPIACRIWR